ncbi:hypothetical protein BN1723_011025 [Verticillium longisporum]|uniref:Uncharacterized protein n=1 Tax=Verticillium longisporum TaxID=100787 RepID=A0A0G4L450_VERLO|nr:hypothetical protein BN1723_011025 [Verticillium longisporum]
MHRSISVAIGVARHGDTKLFQSSLPSRQAMHTHQRKQTSKSPTHVLDEVQSPQDVRHLFHEDKSVARYVTEDSQCHTGPIHRSESTSHGGEHHHEMSR